MTMWLSGCLKLLFQLSSKLLQDYVIHKKIIFEDYILQLYSNSNERFFSLYLISLGDQVDLRYQKVDLMSYRQREIPATRSNI